MKIYNTSEGTKWVDRYGDERSASGSLGERNFGSDDYVRDITTGREVGFVHGGKVYDKCGVWTGEYIY